jgi:hypothetical protein
VLLFIALAFMTVAAALWLGEVLGHASLGFLITGGVFLIASLVTWFVGGKMVLNTVVRYFIDIFFPENDKDHGAQE